jgi:hypothetical protein
LLHDLNVFWEGTKPFRQYFYILRELGKFSEFQLSTVSSGYCRTVKGASR